MSPPSLRCNHWTILRFLSKTFAAVEKASSEKRQGPQNTAGGVKPPISAFPLIFGSYSHVGLSVVILQNHLNTPFGLFWPFPTEFTDKTRLVLGDNVTPGHWTPHLSGATISRTWPMNRECFSLALMDYRSIYYISTFYLPSRYGARILSFFVVFQKEVSRWKLVRQPISLLFNRSSCVWHGSWFSKSLDSSSSNFLVWAGRSLS